MRVLDHLEQLAPNLTHVARDNFFWMTWNSLLAWMPVGIAVFLFRGRPRDHKPSAGWWMGLVLFVLFLPNAPYVVTDLVHLRGDVLLVGHDWPVITGVLPVYAVFIGSGFLAYYLALRELGRYLDRIDQGGWKAGAAIGLHGLCAIGVFLGRHARLNSWEPVVEPHDTLQRMVLTLSWRWAPAAVTATFAVTWLGHFVTRAVVETAWTTLTRRGPGQALLSGS
jgi:uncharacterized membrane protein